jgi:hypothetical protein
MSNCTGGAVGIDARGGGAGSGACATILCRDLKKGLALASGACAAAANESSAGGPSLHVNASAAPRVMTNAIALKG